MSLRGRADNEGHGDRTPGKGVRRYVYEGGPSWVRTPMKGIGRATAREYCERCGQKRRACRSRGTDLVDEMAEALWYEQGHTKPWIAVAEATKAQFRKLAERELSGVFCDA